MLPRRRLRLNEFMLRLRLRLRLLLLLRLLARMREWSTALASYRVECVGERERRRFRLDTDDDSFDRCSSFLRSAFLLLLRCSGLARSSADGDLAESSFCFNRSVKSSLMSFSLSVSRILGATPDLFVITGFNFIEIIDLLGSLMISVASKCSLLTSLPESSLISTPLL